MGGVSSAGSGSAGRAAGGASAGGASFGGASSGGASAGAPSGGRASGGAPSGGTSGGNAPTFTQVYAILTANCTKRGCHGSGSGAGGISFSTKATAYTSAMTGVKVGDASSSGLYSIVESGEMPQGDPKLSEADLKTIADWINAGALNN